MNDTVTTVGEIAVGAAESAADIARNPLKSARKQVKGFERKGAPTVRKINRRLSALLPEKVSVFGIEVNGKLPEKVAIKGLQMVKLQAKRKDVFGDVVKQALKIFNGSFKTIARTATRLEEATELTAQRNGESRPAARPSRRRAARRRAA